MTPDDDNAYWRARSRAQQAVREKRKFTPITCEHCGHVDTEEELAERIRTGHINPEPRRFCSPKCRKAAWEKKNGTRRKREYRARTLPLLIRSRAESEKKNGTRRNVPMLIDGGTASGPEEA
jgi:hypothetical protein